MHEIKEVFGFIVVAALFVIPFAKIMHRAGWSGWMALLFVVPIVGLILLWSFAFGRWPALGKPTQ